MVSGRKMPTDPTSRVNASSSPSATADFPVWPSGEATYTLRVMLGLLRPGRSHGSRYRGKPAREQGHDLVTMVSAERITAGQERKYGTIVGPVAAVPPQIPGLVGWRPLARGGFATVWEAKQLSLNRLVAVKVDRRTLESDTEQRRFLREAGAAGRMSGHPGIVTVHDAGILTDDRPYLVMALCEGGSLTKWVKGEPRPSQEEVREVGVRIADALAATHERGVLHRDVKPANILIDAYGHSGLADFGLAALPDPGMELSETLEAITPAYAPPEVFHRRPPTETGDVYSLGATLYAVLSGRPPRWPEDGTPNLVDMFERLEEPIERIPGVDDELMDTLLAAMAHDPKDRPTAAEFRDRLSAVVLATPATNGSKSNGSAVLGAVAGKSAEGTVDDQTQGGGRAAARHRVHVRPSGQLTERRGQAAAGAADGRSRGRPASVAPTRDPGRCRRDHPGRRRDGGRGERAPAG